jgi:nucleotide-binding universal stress UspA family protein
MLKKILLVLDGSNAGSAAREYAFQLSTAMHAGMTAIGVLDTPWITAAQPEPIGGASFKLQRDEAMIEHTQEHVIHLLESFVQEAAARKIAVESVEAEGFPATEIERLSHEHDLIIIGKTTDFHFDLDEDADVTVRHVARDNPRPLLIVPENPAEGGKVLVALDASLQSSRALHMFLLLGLAMDREVEILSIHEDEELASIIAERGVRMCTLHGVKASARPVRAGGNRGELILKAAKDVKASLLVIGGFSHSFLKELLFGSCTKKLMEGAKIPLFLHH